MEMECKFLRKSSDKVSEFKSGKRGTAGVEIVDYIKSSNIHIVEDNDCVTKQKSRKPADRKASAKTDGGRRAMSVIKNANIKAEVKKTEAPETIEKIDFWTFYDDRIHNIKEVGNSPCIYLYATANDTMEEKLIVNDPHPIPKGGDTQQCPRAVEVEKTVCQNMLSETPTHNTRAGKQELAQSMKKQICAIETQPKSSKTVTDAQGRDNLSRNSV
ncbi:hypothetical protein QAD02_013155 [Eretmocerus hayati]|uniref:Uncharacterized protein n=1 Tax=Eretmocerus hayati TaxID=131215 RepID=A0ACC2P2M6_9HYME|nr:hypothetical protein QAD02_013155 [Eretmocerus hayati]